MQVQVQFRSNATTHGTGTVVDCMLLHGQPNIHQMDDLVLVGRGKVPWWCGVNKQCGASRKRENVLKVAPFLDDSSTVARLFADTRSKMPRPQSPSSIAGHSRHSGVSRFHALFICRACVSLMIRSHDLTLHASAET